MDKKKYTYDEIKRLFSNIDLKKYSKNDYFSINISPLCPVKDTAKQGISRSD